MPDTLDPDVYALAMLDALAEGDDDTAAALLDEAGGGGDGDDDPTPDDQPDDTPDTSLKALSLPPRVLAAVRLHQEADDAGRAELVRLAAEDGEAYERLVDDEVAAGGVFVTKAEWHEEQHPRDHGKFSEKEGAAREPDHIDRRKPRFTGETHYHGSPDEIDQFDDRPTSFATNENHANTFGPNLHAVKLDVRNPVDLSALGSGAGKDSPESERVTAAQLHEALAEYGIDIDFGQPRSGWTSDLLRPHLPEIFRQGRALGYDGLKLGDFKDFEADEVMPFSPKQVKLVARNGEAVGKKTKPAGDKNQFAKLMGDAVGNNFMRTMDELFGAALKGKYGPEVQEHAKKVSDWGSQKFAKLLAEVGGDDGDGTTDAPDTTDADLLKSLPPRVAAAVRLHQQADDAGRAELVRMAADDPEGYERLIDDAVADMVFTKAEAHAPAGGVTVQGKEYRGGEFIPGDVMERATDEEKAAVAGGGRGGRLLDPDDPEELEEIATALREAMEEAVGDPKDQCIACAWAIKRVYPEADIWDGVYNGEPHTLAKLSDVFIDVTADQFDSSDAVRIIDPDDLPREYRRFTRSWDADADPKAKHWDTVDDIEREFRKRVTR